MTDADVHHGEMNSGEPVDCVQCFLEELRDAYRVAAAPPPGRHLTALFAAGLADEKGNRPATAARKANGSAAAQTAGLPTWTRRRLVMMKEMLGQMGAKVAAGAIGAALTMGSLGATGALEAPMRMINDFGNDATNEVACNDASDSGAAAVDTEETGAPAEDAAVPTDLSESCEETGGATVTATSVTTQSGTTSGTTTDDTEGTNGTEVRDLTGSAPATGLPAVPTSVSEAAKVHDFDEACGNHGKYVSHFARTGQEPNCATAARAAGNAPPADAAPQVTESEVGEVEDVPTPKEERKAAKAEHKAAKAEHKAAKAEHKAERKVPTSESNARKGAKARG